MTLKTPPSDFFYCLFWGWRQAGPAVVSRWWCPCPWFSPRGHLLSLYMFIFPHAGPWAHVQELQQGLGADLVLGGCLTGLDRNSTYFSGHMKLLLTEFTCRLVLTVLDILHCLYWQAPLNKTMSQGPVHLKCNCVCVFSVCVCVCVFLKPLWARIYSQLDFLSLGS